MATDYYDVLGISETASSEEVRKAFRRLAREWHPDQLGPNATQAQRSLTEDKYKEISAAYDTLSDAEHRQRYDRQHRQGTNTSSTAKPFGSASQYDPGPRRQPTPTQQTPPERASADTQPAESGGRREGAGLSPWLLLWQRWRLVTVLTAVALLLALVVSSYSRNTSDNSPFLADGADIGPFEMGRTLAEVDHAFGPPEAQHSITAPDSTNGGGGERQFISQQRSLSGERVTLLFAHERYFAQPNSPNYTETQETKLLAYCTDSRRFHLTGNIKIGQTLREVQERFGSQQIIEGEVPVQGWIIHLVDVANNGLMTRSESETISRLAGGEWGEDDVLRTAPSLFTALRC